ncbi:hypothetical protein C8R41DRAFT_869631 [Lentinula lateritia]|uniref:Uncharacterized protein n=1 Tax=Lentinula lateritia TaxID=40482 RepID=A0ABQ8V742_9AGAR|nr:hypothetical protein C8R41DRAFT_869631 [Lentinula lateritia]
MALDASVFGLEGSGSYHKALISHLDDQVKREIYSLKDCLTSVNGSTPMGIFTTNALNIELEVNDNGLRSQDKKYQALFLKTSQLQDIHLGQEITISYVDPFPPWHVRRTQLQSKWNLLCHCMYCDVPWTFPGAISQSNKARYELKTFFKKLPDWEQWCLDEKNKYVLIKMHLRAMQMREKEGLEGFRGVDIAGNSKDVAYMKHINVLVMCYGALANAKEFRKWVNKAREVKLAEGSDSVQAHVKVLDIWLHHQEIQNTWDLAAERLTKFRKTEVVVRYCDLEPESYELYYRPVWDWLQELLLNCDIVSKMEWDARRLFKFDGGSRTWKRFIEEAWSANSWWSFQVSEDAAHSGKADFVNFKNVVWHESAAKIFESMAEYCRTGYTMVCGDGVRRWMYPIVLIKSADYEEQCPIPHDQLLDFDNKYLERTAKDTIEILNNARQKALISKADEEAELKKYSLRPCFNSFFKLAHSDPYAGVSFDDLHFQDSGVWGDHIFEHAKIQINNRSAVTKIDNRNKLSVRFKEFPRWSKLNHFDTGVMKLSFNDGSKHYDISRLFLFAAHDVIPEKEDKAAYTLLKVMRKYINMIMYSGLNVQTSDTIALGHSAIKNFVDMLKVYISLSPDVNKTFNVIKIHYHQHLYDDIENKGVLCGMSTKPNEKFHGPLRKIYLRQTNFKDTAKQIVRFEHQSVVATLIQDEIQILDRYEHGNPELPSDLETPIDNVHFTLGSKLKPVSFAQLEGKDLIFARIHIRLAEFMLTLLTTATNIVRVTYTAHDTVIPYQFLKIRYESLETWRLAVDILHCNPNFHGHPRYDYIIFSGILGPVFAQLHYLLLCNACDSQYLIALVQAYKIINTRSRIDKDLGLLRIRKEHNLEFISVQSIVRGAVVLPISSETDDKFVWDPLDGDMFLRVKKYFPGFTDDEGNISDASDDPEFVPYTLPDLEKITMHNLRQALKKVQDQNQQLLGHNSKLRMQNSDLKSQLALAKRHKNLGKTVGNADPNVNHELVVKLAKKYTVMVYPWPTSNLFMSFPPNNLPDPESPERFKDESAFEAGLINELHLYLNDRDLRKKAAEYSPFQKSVFFLHQAKQGRSLALHTIRECASIIMQGINVKAAVWVTKANLLRRNSTTLRLQLEFPGSSAILRAIFFNKQSLTLDQYSFNYGSSLIGMLWGVKSVNDSSIALSAILVRFLLSDDTEFVPIGKNSQLNYKKNFYSYCAFLNGSKGTNYIKQLYSFFNQRVFLGMPSAAVCSTNDDHKDDAVTQALLAIRLADSCPADTSSLPSIPINIDTDLIPTQFTAMEVEHIDESWPPKDNLTEIPQNMSNGNVQDRGRGWGRGRSWGQGQDRSRSDSQIQSQEASVPAPVRTTRNQKRVV